MDNQEAKFILQSYRPSGQDSSDPTFAEALEQAKTDPTLRNWFKEQQAFDGAFAEHLNGLPVPTDLKKTILLSNKITPIRRRSKMGFLWAAAALLAISVAIAGLLNLKQAPPHETGPTFAEFSKDTTGILTPAFLKLDRQDHKITALTSYLAEQNAPADIQLPPGLQGMPGLGCKVFTWKQQKVSLICFRQSPNGAVHLFVIENTDWSGEAPAEQPTFRQQGNWETASWQTHDKTYLLAGAKESHLQQFF